MPVVEAVADLGAGRIEYDLKVPADVAACQGHFPGLPLVPGVTLIGWAIHLAGLHFGLGRFRGLPNAKFRRLVRPGDCLRLSLEWSADTGRLRYSYAHGAAECARGLIQFQPNV